MFYECDCSCDEGEPADWFFIRKGPLRSWPVNLKCTECFRIIEPQESYEICVGNWGKETLTFVTCLGCINIRNHLCSYGWIYGGLAEQVEECIRFDYRDDPSELDDQEPDEDDYW